MTVYLFHGQEEFLIEKEIKKLKDELLDASFVSMAYKVFYEPDFNTLMECVQSAPLMFGNTLSLIHIEKYFSGNSSSLDDKQIASLEDALKNINEKVNIIFVCEFPRDENRKIDSRKKFYKLLAKYSQVREFAQFKPYDKQLPNEISKIAKEKGLSISSNNIDILIEQIGTNLTLINSELDKLKIAVHPKKTVDSEDIKLFCTSTEDIFSLADFIIQGNKNAAFKQYNILTEKRNPLEIFGVLQSSFQRFIYIKNYENKMSPSDLSAKLKLHEFVIKKTQEKLRKTSLDRLIQIRKNLIDAEYKIKSGQNSESETILEMAILS